MLDFIKNAVNTLAGPMASAVDFAGDKLGLPPMLTNSIKAAVGVVSGNVMMTASGALGVMSELQKNPPAQTEFCPSPDAAKAQEGYAPEEHTASAAPKTKKMTWEAIQSTASAIRERAASTSSTGTSSAGTLDPSVLEYRDALRTLAANFDMLDTLCGKRDGKIDAQTLAMAANLSTLSPALRNAARFLVEHPEYRNMVDTAGKGGSVDGTISQLDVQQALTKVNSDIARHGVRQPSQPQPTPAPSTPAPAPSAPAPSQGSPPCGQPTTPVETCPRPTTPVPSPLPKPPASSNSVNDIINNPNMSLEEKLQAILTLITRDTDDEILDVMKEMASVRDERAGLGTDESSRAREAKLETTMEQLNLRLQKLMEKRKQMFDLMSNISSKFNEMAKQAIENMGRA
ncbi:hypothetical protein [Hyalangium versicolor]|uniref:hypothetical protein n=1 Tax=Hyalangium versicolor TaxID=2861190 RepID=UPI001CCDEA45|nr:hypothetical protein [Hyalangium versicolor]